MKKFLISSLLMTLILFISGCDFFVNVSRVYYDLLGIFDSVTVKEHEFLKMYDYYIDDLDFRILEPSAKNFIQTIDNLDFYIENTRFAEVHEPYVSAYYFFYKPFINEYKGVVEDAMKDISENELTKEDLIAYRATFRDYSAKLEAVNEQYINILVGYFNSSLISEDIRDYGKTLNE